ISRIAERLGLSPSCVKKFCRRFRDFGQHGLLLGGQAGDQTLADSRHQLSRDCQRAKPCSQLAGKALDSEVQIVTGDLRAWSRCTAANLVTMCDRRRGTKCHRLTLTSDIYSSLSATIGSTFVARRAGM